MTMPMSTPTELPAGVELPGGQCKVTICNTVAEVCDAAYGERLRAGVLTGSLARNEGTFLRNGPGWSLPGDAEFILIFRDAQRLPGEREITDLQSAIERQLLTCGVECPISLGAAHGQYLRKLEPRIFSFELRACGEVIWGEPGILNLIPSFPPSAIPLEDAWRLLCNRIVEQCGAALDYSDQSSCLSPRMQYATVKLYLDMATSLLVFAGAYAPTYRGRELRLAELAESRRDVRPWPFDLSDFSRRVSLCTTWKLTSRIPPAEVTFQLWCDAVEFARRLWLWETAALTGSSANLPVTELCRACNGTQHFGKRVRGWLYVLRRQGWWHSWRHWPRWMRQSTQGSPRRLVYSAACELLFQLPGILSKRAGTLTTASDLESRLPIIPQSGRNLRSVASNIVWNYQKFLTGTSS
jgi:hypothetical protein